MRLVEEITQIHVKQRSFCFPFPLLGSDSKPRSIFTLSFTRFPVVKSAGLISLTQTGQESITWEKPVETKRGVLHVLCSSADWIQGVLLEVLACCSRSLPPIRALHHFLPFVTSRWARCISTADGTVGPACESCSLKASHSTHHHLVLFCLCLQHRHWLLSIAHVKLHNSQN